MKILNKIRKTWNNIPNSVKFWNGLLLLILTISGIYSIALLAVLLIIGSIIAFLITVLHEDDDCIHTHIWIVFTPFFWIAKLIVAVIFLGMFIHDYGIVPFNNWLNKKK